MMSRQEGNEKISPTARYVAHIRTYTDIPYAKEIAEESQAERDFQALAGESAESVIQLTPIWEARYKATNRIIAQRRITQVLELAAGLSPRGLALTENPGVVYVATDLPQILAQIKTLAGVILAKLPSQRPNLYFRVVNALERDELLQAASPFQSGRPIAVITEGLLSYLTRAEKETLAANIHALLKEYGGIWITPDVSSKQSWQRIAQDDENCVQQRIRNISGATGSDIENNTFVDEDDMRQFFSKAGFAIEEYPHTSVIDELTSIASLNLNRERVLKLLRVTKTLILTA
ncbi:class I SAM-dependent methyltransferase [Desulfosporosinus sp. PR]|uniref:class I SAM-dependent methyltransferase n=1 Tax=Candidatus Desulfosporosinus nitrosoreducens TaxID=3401928 RepID=UPI0027FE2255|nr:class I SAM-dependent methyltransferase [Desulfosporosinus sp. PR]MDQ7094332.1 class I SAM-dependent methyltransferase [Desulfosporosinus sp. PR]